MRRWLASGELGNSDNMTVGQVVIRTGQDNSLHKHLNCEEVLHLLAGELAHTAAPQGVFHLCAGDTITIPADVSHNARSVGDRDALMIVTYSSADRDVEGE